MLFKSSSFSAFSYSYLSYLFFFWRVFCPSNFNHNSIIFSSLSSYSDNLFNFDAFRSSFFQFSEKETSMKHLKFGWSLSIKICLSFLKAFFSLSLSVLIQDSLLVCLFRICIFRPHSAASFPFQKQNLVDFHSPTSRRQNPFSNDVWKWARIQRGFLRPPIHPPSPSPSPSHTASFCWCPFHHPTPPSSKREGICLRNDFFPSPSISFSFPRHCKIDYEERRIHWRNKQALRSNSFSLMKDESNHVKKLGQCISIWEVDL